MNQRTLATVLAVPLVVALLVAAWRQPLPYVTYEPGLTVDVLGERDGEEIIDVEGRRVYRDDGELRMTTVYVSRPRSEINLLELMGDWISRTDAVYPYDAVYRPDETAEESETEGAVEMVSSQDTAIAVALTELGYEVTPAPAVLYVEQGSPADGPLRVRDVFLEVDGEDVTDAEQLVEAISATEPGDEVELVVLRKGERQRVLVRPRADSDGEPRIGVRLGRGFIFPFQVSVDVDPAIGGPSAGLVFSLAIYDTLTPGSLTGGRIVAGTGTVDQDGRVGPIGGIQQKIAGAEHDGAELFLVPPDNCEEAVHAPVADLRLVKAETMHSARTSIEAWVADPDADLPSCEENR